MRGSHLSSKCLLSFFLIFFMITSYAGDTESTRANIIKSAQQKGLIYHPTWLKLLHYDKSDGRSEVVSDEFFLSEQGKEDASAELLATLDAYMAPWGENGDEHARCRFPARYYWLNHQIKLPGYQLREPRCKKFEQWALLDKVDSISLLLVSGYYGNPASTFGHSLLKLNSTKTIPGSDLFDLTVNFGAMIPPNESTLLYIMRGLSGGYEAGFSDRYYYTQDLVYSRTEFRDIWDYRLNLSDHQRTLLLLHLWEVMENKFIYYFLSENCAYRISELLELVTEESFLDNSSIWYAPVETFHRLDAIDHERDTQQQPRLVEKVSFIPSSQRTLYQQVSQLSEDGINAVNTVIGGNYRQIDPELERFSPQQQIRIANALIAYYQYRITAEQPEPPPELKVAKDRALLKRLTLPSARSEEIAMPQRLSPAASAPPLLSGIGAGHGADGLDYLQLRLAPYSYERLARNSSDNDELVVMDALLGIDSKQLPFLERFDLIRISALQTNRIPIDGERRPSWQMRIGAERVFDGLDNQLDAVASFGMGMGWELGPTVSLYAMADVAGHSYPAAITLEPNMGVSLAHGPLRAEFSYRATLDSVRRELTETSRGLFQFQLGKKHALRAELRHRTESSASISYLHYW